jgi:hypothetical protein
MTAFPDAPWTVAQGEYDGRPIFVRINTGAARVAKDIALRHRLGVAVPLRAANSEGLPGADEAIVLQQIEDALGEALRLGAEVVFVLAITTAGMREFVFHSAFPDHIPIAISSVRGRFPDYDIQFITEDDPDWAVYQQFAGAL